MEESMKRHVLSILSFCLAIILTVGIASGVARACAGMVAAGGNGNDYVWCDLTGSDSNWCYYDCTCGAVSGDCEYIYQQLGLEAY